MNASSVAVQKGLVETGKEASANLEAAVDNMFNILKMTVPFHDYCIIHMRPCDVDTTICCRSR